MLLPTNAVAFAARSWDFFLYQTIFCGFKKLWARNKCGCAFAARPWFFFFFVGYLGWRFLIRILLPFGRDSSLASNVEPKIATIENFKSLREWKFATVTTFRRFARSQKKEPRWRLGCWRRIFAARCFSQFCDFSILAISTTFVKIRHDDFRSKTTLVIFQKAHLTRHAKIF